MTNCFLHAGECLFLSFRSQKIKYKVACVSCSLANHMNTLIYKNNFYQTQEILIREKTYKIAKNQISYRFLLISRFTAQFDTNSFKNLLNAKS